MARRRPLVVLLLVLGSASACVSAAGCGTKRNQLHESRRLVAEGTTMRDAGFAAGDQKKFEEGQEMIDRGNRMRESALQGM